MATSLDALEALLQFSEGVPKEMNHVSCARSLNVRPAAPVPNPLDPSQPHVIEGDSPTQTPNFNQPSIENDAKPDHSARSSMTPVVTSVPNPLAMSLTYRHPVQHPTPTPIAAANAMAPSSTPNKILNHGFVVNSPMPMPAVSSIDVKPICSLDEMRSDKIRDALNSKPQRGKKRQNLTEVERVELTRTRNREHAKSTRMKKKARLEELLETEKRYLLLKGKELLFNSRRKNLIQFLEDVGNANSSEQRDAKDYSSRLKELASEKLLTPKFTSVDRVALSNENSGMVKVSVQGQDVESGNTKTLNGVVCVDFTPRTPDIAAVFLYWSSPKSTPLSVGMFPSVSVLSFDP